MASAIIHMSVAKKINENLNLDTKLFYLGSVAPDISKQIGLSRKKSHFILDSENTDAPDLNRFIDKYGKQHFNAFELGYFIHLITDYLWFTSFLNKFVDNNIVKLKNGKRIELDGNYITKLLYNDYTDLASKVLDYYNMDLSVFYDEYDLPESFIEEIPCNKLNIIKDKMSLICSMDATNKEYIITLKPVINFIDDAYTYCLDYLDKNNIKF